MNLKKIFSAFTAGIVAAAAIASSVSAGNLSVLPDTTNTYEVKLTAVIDAMEYNYTTTDTISVGLYSGMTTTLTDGSTNQTATLKNVTLNNAPINQSVINFGFMTTTNTIAAGKISRFTWSATAVLSNATTDPATILNISSTKAPLTITIGGSTVDVSDRMTATSNVVASTSSLKSGIIITPRSFNGGKGLTVAERSALAAAKSNITVTVNLTKPVEAVLEAFTFTSDVTNVPIYQTASKGQTAVVFSVPASTIYDPVYAMLFSSIVINGGKEYSSIVFTYPDSENGGSTDSTVTGDEGDAIDDEEATVTINYSAVTLNVGTKLKLETSEAVTWKTSSKSTVVVYKSGNIKPLKAGTATITGTTASGAKVTCKVTAVNSSNPSTDFDLTNSKGTVRIGKKYSLKYTMNPSASTDKITWTSSDTSVATISSSGKITPLKVGTVTITATTSSGLKDTCVLTVKTAN